MPRNNYSFSPAATQTLSPIYYTLSSQTHSLSQSIPHIYYQEYSLIQFWSLNLNSNSLAEYFIFNSLMCIYIIIRSFYDVLGASSYCSISCMIKLAFIVGDVSYAIEIGLIYCRVGRGVEFVLSGMCAFVGVRGYG